MNEMRPISAETGLPIGETEAERRLRVAREMEIVARAEAAIDAGLGIDGDDLEAWLLALDEDENAPIPPPRGLTAQPR